MTISFNIDEHDVIVSAFFSILFSHFNNLFLEISIRVEVKEKISLPTSSKVSTVFFDVPISMQVIPGKIPNYYGGIIDSNSSMSFYSYK